ncbi:MAG: hypothetical protein WCX70_01465 [Candidatus Paceibacterota bacterium]|jgi:hypothetical protein
MFEKIPNGNNKKFESLGELRQHFEQIYQTEIRQEDVSHLTFGEAFNVNELTEEDLEMWNLAQDYFGNSISFAEFQKDFREYQISLANESFLSSSRGKFLSYLSNLATKKYWENNRSMG